MTLAPGRLDLHTHSTFSDGTCSVPRLIDEARAQGLSGIAVPGMVAAGLLGIEAYHHAHTPEHIRQAHELAERYDLFITGGSDYHGHWGVPDRIGQYGISVEEAGAPVADLFERDASL